MRFFSALLTFMYSLSASAGPRQDVESFFRRIRTVEAYKTFILNADITDKDRARLIKPLNQFSPRATLPTLRFDDRKVYVNDGRKEIVVQAYPEKSSIDINGRIMRVDKNDFEGNMHKITQGLSRSRVSYFNIVFPQAHAFDTESMMLGMMIASIIPMLMGGGQSPMGALVPIMMFGLGSMMSSGQAGSTSR